MFRNRNLAKKFSFVSIVYEFASEQEYYQILKTNKVPIKNVKYKIYYKDNKEKQQVVKAMKEYDKNNS